MGFKRTIGLSLCAVLVALPATAGAMTERGEHLDAPAPSDRSRNYPDSIYERVYVEMRDGVELSADIYRPVTPKGVKVPVILNLTPYHVLNRALDRNEEDLPSGDAALFVPKGYAYVRADVRGTYNSGGCWDYGGIKEREDGYDLVEWLGTRPWSNGKVAMTGGSYDGTTANAAAIENPPHLATIIPISAISRWWGYAYQQGARSLYSGESVDIDPPSDTPADFMFAYGGLPPPDPALVTQAQQIAMRWNLCDRVSQTEHGYSSEPDYDRFWKERDYLRRAHKVKVPALITHGQLDFNVKTWEGTQWFEALRGEKLLLVGQWAHASPRGRYAEWDLLLERWLERWLYGVKNGVEKGPSVLVQGADDEWYSRSEWASKKKRTFDLSGGEFRYTDDGLLTESEMIRGVGQGRRYIRVDLEDATDLWIQGRPVLRLRASSDSTSTHFVAVLCDVGPSGACGQVISRAFMNARYHAGLGKGRDLEPGKTYTFPLEFIDKDYIVEPGHHLALLIGSSSTSWVVPDQQRATNLLDLDASRLVVPVAR